MSFFKKIFLIKHPLVKVALIFVSAGLVTTALFYFMARAIFQDKDLSFLKSDKLSLDFSMQKTDRDLKTKRRSVVKKKPVQKPPKLKPMKLIQTKFTPKNLGAGTAHLLDSMNLEDGMGIGQVTPIVRIAPQYPVEAAMRGVEGWVLLKFDITTTGSVENIKVIRAHPVRTFERAAMTALAKWKYKPKIKNKRAVAQRNNMTQIDFKLKK